MKSTILLSAVALSAGLIMSGGTRAEEGLVGQLGFFGVGKAYEIEKGHFFWVGEFSGTFFSDKGEKGVFDHAGVKCPAWDDSDVNNKKDKAGGFCTFTDLSGDQAYMTWQEMRGVRKSARATPERTCGRVERENTKKSRGMAFISPSPRSTGRTAPLPATPS
jgi:hypothetical protein